MVRRKIRRSLVSDSGNGFDVSGCVRRSVGFGSFPELEQWLHCRASQNPWAGAVGHGEQGFLNHRQDEEGEEARLSVAR